MNLAAKGASGLGSAVSKVQGTGGRNGFASGNSGMLDKLGGIMGGPKLEGGLGEKTKDFENYLTGKGFYRTIDDMNEILKDRNPKDHWQKGEQELRDNTESV